MVPLGWAENSLCSLITRQLLVACTQDPFNTCSFVFLYSIQFWKSNKCHNLLPHSLPQSPLPCLLGINVYVQFMWSCIVAISIVIVTLLQYCHAEHPFNILSKVCFFWLQLTNLDAHYCIREKRNVIWDKLGQTTFSAFELLCCLSCLALIFCLAHCHTNTLDSCLPETERENK